MQRLNSPRLTSWLVDRLIDLTSSPCGESDGSKDTLIGAASCSRDMVDLDSFC